MFKWARIFLIIFSRAELRWIYKDTDNRGSIGTRKPLRSINEGKVSLMKGSHGGHEDYWPRQPTAESLHAGHRFNYSHRKRSSSLPWVEGITQTISQKVQGEERQ